MSSNKNSPLRPSKSKRLRTDRSSPDRYLLVEQSGFQWLLAGLFISLAIGIGIQWVTDPTKIRPLLERELSKNHFTFESVHFQLASGIIPEFAFYVHNLQGSISLACENDATVRMDDVRVPIGISDLLRKQFRLSRFEIGDVHVERLNDCAQSSTTKDAAKKTAGATESAPPFAAPIFGSNSNGSPKDKARGKINLPIGQWLGDIYIQYLHYTDHLSQIVLDFYRVQASSDESKIQLRGIINFANESVVTSYTPQASFEVWGDATGETQASIAGNWREGQFNAMAHLNLNTEKIDSQIKIDHLPFSEFLPFFKKVGMLDNNYNFANTWLNLRAATVGQVSLSKLGPIRVGVAEVFGDAGSLSASDVEFESLTPLTYPPMRLKISSLRLGSFLKNLNVQNFPPFLGEIGVSNGFMIYSSPEKFRMDIEHSGLEFVFSNRGEREKQTVSRFDGHVLFDHGHWNASLDHIQLVEGLFDGEVTVIAEPGKAHADVHANELTLAAPVQRLMTRDGSLGRWSGDASISLSKLGKISNSKIDMRASDLDIEKLTIKRVRVNGESFPGTKGNLKTKLEISASGLSLSKTSPLYGTLEPLLNEHLEFDGLDGSVTTDTDADEFSWKVSSLKSADLLITALGSWNAQGTLVGSALVKTAKKKQNWLLTGTRAEPQWTEKR